MAKKSIVTIYDFDHTIYDGDASVDFYLYSVLHQPSLLKYVPYQGWHILLYILGLHSRKAFKERFFVFLKSLKNTDKAVDKFWQRNARKIKGWYLSRDHSSDVIISASPDFLLRPMSDTLGVHALIATNMDRKTGTINGENCRGEEKVLRLERELGKIKVESTYSDSLSDMPIFNLANNAYVVRNNSLTPLKEYKPSKLKSMFLRKNFLTFIVVGGFNAFTGVLFAFIASQFIENGTVAFAVGYAFSLTISYFLNSAVTFNTREFSVKRFVKFCISYIPNFAIQLISVYILIGVLSVDKLLAYTISVIVGIPVTFFILSVFAFRKKGKK